MKQRKTLAVLIDHLDSMVGGYAGQLRAAFDTECAKLDHDLLIAVGRSLGGPDAAERAQNSVYDLIGDGSVDGVVLVSGGLASFSGASSLDALCQRLKPLPLCSVGLEIPGVPGIVIDPRPGLWELVDHLVRVHHCRRIAFVGGPTNNPEAEERLRFFVEAIERHGLGHGPELIESGPFTLLAGSEGTARILERGTHPDAIVAANDAIALGAIKMLQSHGLRVPDDVIVTGFDDLAFARFSSPPLTTIRQPLARMAALAIRSLHGQLQGLSSSRRTELPVELMVRDSCGCGERSSEVLPPSNRVVMHPSDYLDAQASRIQTDLKGSIELPETAGSSWHESVMQALKLELTGDRGALAGCLDEIMSQVGEDLQVYDELQKLVTRLRDALSAVSNAALEEVWHSARRNIARANSQGHARLRQELDLVYQQLLHTGERFACALEVERLKRVMEEELPHVNVRDALVMRYQAADRKELRPLFCMREGAVIELEPVPYASQLLLPPGAPRAQSRTTAFVLPLTFGAETLGVAVFGARSGVHEMLRVQIGVALKTAAMQELLVNRAISDSAAPRPSAARLKQLGGLLNAVARDLERAAAEFGVGEPDNSSER